MSKTMTATSHDASKGKHKKWGKSRSDDDPSDREFMNGDLNEDLHSLVKSLNLPEAAAKYAAGQEKEDEKPERHQKKTALKHKVTKLVEPEAPLQPSTSKPVVPLPKKHIKWAADEEKVGVPSAAPASRKGKKRRLTVEPIPHWYKSLPPLEPLPSVPQPSPEYVTTLRQKAEALLQEEAEIAGSSATGDSAMGSSDKAFLARMISSGTSSDRLSALTLMAQASPLHNQRALESLKSMASKRGREESLKALRAIVDLWVGGMAPERKLRYFVDQNLTHPAVGDKHLILWAFEDWLKKYFFSLLQTLESLTLDTLPYVRTQALNLIYVLLRDRPEQEQNLLRLLANKLGDTDKSVAAKASYFLLQLLQQHPQMKAIVVREVSALILRPSTSSSTQASSSSSSSTLHARYYGVLTFNQIILTHQEKDVAQLLTTLYFELFVTILGASSITDDADDEAEAEEGGVEEGGKKKKHVRRAPLPRDRRKLKSRAERESQKKGIPAMVHVGDAGFGEVEDGQSKMIAGILTGLNRALPFARMEEMIFEKHIDTLFRITHSATFNVSIQALVLILQVSSTRQSISDRFYRTLYESLLDPRLVMSSKQAMYLNLLFKAAKLDNNHERLCAFVKRFLQALGMHQPSFICGALFLLGELFAMRPDLQQMARNSPEAGPAEKTTKSKSGTPSQPEPTVYDPRKRDPQFANAASAPLWEIVPLLHHFHPSVALHARQVLNGKPVTTTADLSLNTVSLFLDRFVYKNAKKPTARGASLMQPGSVQDGTTTLVRQVRGVGDGGLVNDESFWNKPVGQVPVDQLFFHKFFQLRKKGSKADKKPRKNKNDELDDGDDLDGDDSESGPASDGEEDEEEEARIWQAMKKSMPGGGLGDDVGDMDADEDDEDSLPDDFDASEEGDLHLSGDDEIHPLDDDEADAMDEEDDSNASDDALVGLIDVESEEGSDADWGGLTGEKRKKGKEDKEQSGTKKKRKVALPTFASYEDYAKMIDEAEEGS